jgi:hypothetical protein
VRSLSTLVRGALLALVVLSLASVTAGAAVRGNAANGDGSGSSNSSGKGDGSGIPGVPGTPLVPLPDAPSTVPAIIPAPSVLPGQAKKDATAGPSTAAPGQADAAPADRGARPAGSDPAAGGQARTPADARTPTPLPPAAAPVLGTSMAVRPLEGSVQIRLPRSSGFVALGDGASIPSGAVVDARGGTLELRSALDAQGHTQTARVRGAVFEVRQSPTGHGMTDLVLRGGPPAGCRASATARAAGVAAAKPPRPKPGTLWVQDSHGRFRSRGRNSVATVRGTRWTTRETCAGTLTRVLAGAVDVRDLVRDRTVTVRAGQAYLARSSR